MSTRIEEHAQLAAKVEAFNTASDAAQDAQLALERFQRELVIKYEIRDGDKIDQFGFITRGV